MKQIIKKRYDLQIGEAGSVKREQFELDKNVSKVNAILLTSDKEDQLYNRGSQKIEINGQEIFPEKYESKLLMSGLNVSPNDRFYKLENIAVGNRIMKVEYTDNNEARSNFSAYRVSVYLELETETN
ncbi:MAG: hypothetical protein JNM95_12105 [Chitinophagaceae bacterium]|nr:hypothetical protein [Chitinophagaceae bacterium]